MTGLTPKQLEASDLTRNLVVTAGAGSGKTKVLVERYIKVLVEDPSLRPRNILALTFTEKAASEMRAKVRRAIKRESERDPERFEPMLAELDQSDISTIHSFCTRLIRSDPLGLGLCPDFDVLTESRAATLLDDARRAVFNSTGPESAALRRLLVDYGAYRTTEVLKGIAKERARSRMDPGSVEFKEASLSYLDRCTSELREEAMGSYGAFVRAVEGLRALPPVSGADEAATIVSRLVRIDVNDRDPALSIVGQMVPDLLTKKNEPRSMTNFGSAKVWGGSVSSMRRHLGEVALFAKENREYLLYVSDPSTAGRARQALTDLIDVHQAVKKRYCELKLRRSCIDFEDMIDLSLSVLASGKGETAERLRGQYRHIMVDEFQDTDPRQWELIKSLWDRDGGSKLFLVGDPKQSIYGFRSSDVRLFAGALRGTGEVRIGEPVVLDLNFRSRSEIMDLVNSLFPSIMESESEWGVEFEPLRPHKGHGGTVSFIGVEGEDGCDHREGLAAARTVRRAIREGWTTLDPDTGEERPIGYRDIALLFKARTGLKEYERAFRAEGVPFVVYKGKGFYDRQEVSDLLQMLRWLCTPTDDVALASVLKGPFFLMDDQRLLSASLRCRGSLMERLRSDPDHTRTVERLDRYLNLARTFPAHIALPRIITESDIYACMQGARECRNLDRIMELFAESEGRSVFDLRDEIAEVMEAGSTEGEPTLPAAEAVTMLTIHAAKGLEWPLVFLMGMHHVFPRKGGALFKIDPDGGASLKVFDPTSGEMLETPSTIISRRDREERDAEEDKRLFYVACTRAKDHLVLCGRVPSTNDNSIGPPLGFVKYILGEGGNDQVPFEKGAMEIGGVKVRLERVGRVLGGEVEERSNNVLVGPPDLRLAAPIEGAGASDEMNPSGEHDDWTFTPPAQGDLSTPEQFGTMVHEVLMSRDPRRVVDEHGFPEERDLVLEVVGRLEAHVPKEGVEAVWNEVSVVNDRDGGRVVGRIDRLLRMGDGSYLVIDFKTGSRSEGHAGQVRSYMEAVGRIAGAPVGGMIVYPDGVERIVQ